ncbi:MAG: alkaline phosphatase family protein [Candidatus Hodarchaeota archaeon]
MDGGDFNHIFPYVKEGLLPNFKRLLKNGFYSKLRVTIPPVTIPSFPCLFSGLSTLDLGYCTFYDPSFGVFSSHLWKEKSIFNNENIRTFCLNLPSTYPAWNINGEMITGLLTPRLSEKMYFPNYLGEFIDQNWIIDGSNIDEIFKAFETKKELFLKKIREPFNLLVYIVRVPDCITHHPKYKLGLTQNILKDGYIKIDEFLGEILDSNDFDNLFIISDHGLDTYKYEFNIKRFLEKEGILFYNTEFLSKLMSLFIKIFGLINRNIFDTTFFHNRFKYYLTRIKGKFGSKISHEKKKVSLSKSRFLHFYSNYGGIYLSKKEKKLKKYLEIALKKCKYVERLIEFDSKYLPDYIIVMKKNILFSVKSSYFVKNHFNSLNHSEIGIFIAYGKDVLKTKIREISYLDFVPLLLKLYGIITPPHIKGKIPNIIKERDFIQD